MVIAGGAAGTGIPAARVSPPAGANGEEVSLVARGRDWVMGEQLAQVDNRDPFAVPVWRSPVYRTPEPVIMVVQLVHKQFEHRAPPIIDVGQGHFSVSRRFVDY